MYVLLHNKIPKYIIIYYQLFIIIIAKKKKKKYNNKTINNNYNFSFLLDFSNEQFIK